MSSVVSPVAYTITSIAFMTHHSANDASDLTHSLGRSLQFFLGNPCAVLVHARPTPAFLNIWWSAGTAVAARLDVRTGGRGLTWSIVGHDESPNRTWRDPTISERY